MPAGEEDRSSVPAVCVSHRFIPLLWRCLFRRRGGKLEEFQRLSSAVILPRRRKVNDRKRMVGMPSASNCEQTFIYNSKCAVKIKDSALVTSTWQYVSTGSLSCVFAPVHAESSNDPHAHHLIILCDIFKRWMWHHFSLSERKKNLSTLLFSDPPPRAGVFFRGDLLIVLLQIPSNHSNDQTKPLSSLWLLRSYAH